MALAHLFRGLVPPPGAQTCRIAPPGIGPLRISGNPQSDPFIFGQLRRGEVFEPHILAALRTLIQPGHCVLDVGANIGWFTLCMARLAGSGGTVVAVEPEPGNLRLLYRNLRQNGCRAVNVVAAAAGETAGQTLLRLSDANAGDHRIGGRAGQAGTVSVPVIALDSLAVECGVGPLVVKIDAQGAETSILRGAASLLERRPVRMVVEFWPFGLLDCGTSPAALLDLIAPRFDRLWALFKDHKPWPVTPDQLLDMARNGLSPQTQMFTDIIALRSSDAAAVAAVERGEYWQVPA